MNTDITHRAMSIKSKRFVYGNFHINKSGQSVISRYDNSNGIITNKTWVVDPKTLGRFIEAYDKKGVTIFEGDEVLHEWERTDCDGVTVRNEHARGYIFYDVESQGFKVLLDSSSFLRKRASINMFEADQWEVKGNINKIDTPHYSHIWEN